MNQAVLFSDDEQFNEQLQQVAFHAQSQGQLILCIISLTKLLELAGETIQTNASEIALALFEEYRFDIEELTEHKIQQQDFDHHGQIIL